MDITDTLDYDSIDPKTLTAVNTRELDAPRHGHEHHGVVYSNKLPLNHDTASCPVLRGEATWSVPGANFVFSH